jgi:hypothetical protein
MLDRDTNLVDARTEVQLAPLHYAVTGGHLQRVGRFLLDRGTAVPPLLNCRVGERGIRRIWRCNAFTHAFLVRRYSEALMLLDLDPDLAVPRHNGLHPSQACPLAPNLCEIDEDKMILILRHLLPRASPHAITNSKSVHLFVDRYHGETPSPDLETVIGDC